MQEVLFDSTKQAKVAELEQELNFSAGDDLLWTNPVQKVEEIARTLHRIPNAGIVLELDSPDERAILREAFVLIFQEDWKHESIDVEQGWWQVELHNGSILRIGKKK